MQRTFKYIFGPVYSWRLGISVGIDLLSNDAKVCNFNCEYCQLGETVQYRTDRKVFVPTADIMEEIKAFPEEKFDYYTFSSSGEPTLAQNIGEVIRALKSFRPEKKVAVITNASLLSQEAVRCDLFEADLVLAKLDACSPESLKLINSPSEDISWEAIVEGIKHFRKEFHGTLALQIMFVADNKDQAAQIAMVAAELAPDEVQLNTPLRPCPVSPLSEEELAAIKKEFSGVNAVCKTVYEAKKQTVKPLDEENTRKRHGNVSFSED